MPVHHAHSRGVGHRDTSTATYPRAEGGKTRGVAATTRPSRCSTSGWPDRFERCTPTRVALSEWERDMGYREGHVDRARHGRTDPRTDIYAIGCIAFELVAGVRVHWQQNDMIHSTLPRKQPRCRACAARDYRPKLDAIILRGSRRNPRIGARRRQIYTPHAQGTGRTTRPRPKDKDPQEMLP